MKKILLHSCCGPCSIYPVDYMREQGMEVHSYFFNPNIHPYTEFTRRKETMEKYAVDTGLKLIVDDDYRLEEFLRGGVPGVQPLYDLLFAASGAGRTDCKTGKFDGFTTTLLVSPYQKHELIRDVGQSAGDKYGSPLLCGF